MNAKKEFLNHVQRELKCAIINCKPHLCLLKCDYSEQDYQKFIDSLDFEYDDGYGTQNLYGTIWYTDGTFSERAEYDGSEWWRYVSVPEIPTELSYE